MARFKLHHGQYHKEAHFEGPAFRHAQDIKLAVRMASAYTYIALAEFIRKGQLKLVMDESDQLSGLTHARSSLLEDTVTWQLFKNAFVSHYAAS